MTHPLASTSAAPSVPYVSAGLRPATSRSWISDGSPPRTARSQRWSRSPMDSKLLLEAHPEVALSAVGRRCGGPLDSTQGLILSPPNLPGWDRVDVVTPFRERFGVPTSLQNDANACAVAEWQWGAGRGVRSMVFLTFGTGMGAGLILDGRLYAGASDMAGEVGHIRLAEDGPLGYGKRGSFEGFCSGSGIARLAQSRALEAIQAGTPPAFCPTLADLDKVTAASVGKAAQAGDLLARAIYETGWAIT